MSAPGTHYPDQGYVLRLEIAAALLYDALAQVLGHPGAATLTGRHLRLGALESARLLVPDISQMAEAMTKWPPKVTE